jgi:hypothetical protein
MTDEQLIILQAKKIFELEETANKYGKWYTDSEKEVQILKAEIQQIQQKLNGSQDFATINTNEHPKHG